MQPQINFVSQDELQRLHEAALWLLHNVGMQVFSTEAAMNIEAIEYVEAARLRDEKIWWLMLHEILPNVMPLLVAEFGLRFCFAFLCMPALSLLGLGIQPPTADWGGMVCENGGRSASASSPAMAGRGNCISGGWGQFNRRLVSIHRQWTERLSNQFY
ncbi:MAG TPA: ABC transporter permease subunit [Desulfatiglandales bacterium]|nr:ABC transporter permease subunit [Desulfatiglandales bacterium]